MAIRIDDTKDWPEVEIDGKWYLSKPCINVFIYRLKDAWGVLTGRYEAVSFEREERQRQALHPEASDGPHPTPNSRINRIRTSKTFSGLDSGSTFQAVISKSRSASQKNGFGGCCISNRTLLSISLSMI